MNPVHVWAFSVHLSGLLVDAAMSFKALPFRNADNVYVFRDLCHRRVFVQTCLVSLSMENDITSTAVYQRSEDRFIINLTRFLSYFLLR